MHDILAVRVGERAGDLPAVVNRLCFGHRSRRHARREGRAFDVLHDDVRLAVVFDDVVDGGDVGVIEAGDDTRLVQDVSGRALVARMHALDRDVAAERLIRARNTSPMPPAPSGRSSS